MPSPENVSELTQTPVFELEAAEWEAAQKLARQCGLPCLSLRDLEIDRALVKRVPLEVLETYHMVPLSEEAGVITLAMSDPLDVMGEDMMRFATGCKVKRVVAPASHIEEALKGRSQPAESLLDTILRRIPESSEITYIQSADAASQRQEQESAEMEPTAPIIQLVSSIIGDAIRMRASDIHVEPLKHAMRVRYRIDGYLRTIVELPQRVQSACITRFKIISGLDISESRKPQDGRTRAVLEGREVDMRVSSLPTYFGEKIVLRILDPQAVMVDLENLGLNPENLDSVKQILASSQGMILCTGPTGSGKTSTLYSALLKLNQECDNVVTVEDPIEYQLEGINQVQVNTRAGVSFASALRSILRQDPDVVLIGEIRDLETAEIAVQSAQTGHLVLSTLHTNDALSTVNRLVLMGIAPYLLASSLLCVIAQRLVRRLCPACRKAGTPSPEALALLRSAGISRAPEQTFLALGCEQCNFIGYKGRMGLFEILIATDRVRQLLLQQASEADIEQLARGEGMRSLLEDGLAKCEQGWTSLDEVLRVLTLRRVGGRRCPHCQASISLDYPYCGYCGAEVLHLCSQCQTALQPDWQFCPRCRQQLTPQPQAPTPPEAPAESPPGPVGEAPGEPLTQQKWVLLIIEDSLLRAQLCACLVEEEYCVITAEEASRAQVLVHYHLPDLIVLDLEIKEFQAASWIAWLRSQLQCALIPVLLLSQLGPQGLEGLNFGADGVLVKPFQETRFLHRVEELLQFHPRMAGPPQPGPAGPNLHLPRYLTDPLRRLLGAAHVRHYALAVCELAALAQRVVQYCYSLAVASLRHLEHWPAAPLWADPAGPEALEEKCCNLPLHAQELRAQVSPGSVLQPLLEVVELGARLTPQLRELWLSQPTPEDRKVRVAHGMGLLRPWLEKARALSSQAEHLLDEPDTRGAISGAIQLGELVLPLDEPALYLHASMLVPP